MATQQDFALKGIIERIFLKKIYENITQNNPQFDWKINMTCETSRDLYDSRIIKFNKNTSEVITNYYVEIKVREKDWDDLMLEKKKYNDVSKLINRMDIKMNAECFTNITSEFLYISVTPNGTWLWNLTKVLDKIEWELKDCPVCTVDPSRGRIMKECTMLDKSKAKFFKYTNKDIDNTDENKIVKVMINQKQNLCIFRNW